MKTLHVFYFSGTGNTRFIADRLCEKLSSQFRSEQFDVAAREDLSGAVSSADALLFAFPIYGSSPPIPMRQFVHRYGSLFKGKPVYLAETQYFYSGDGAASLGRTIEKYGGTVLGAEHFNMPNNLSDCKFFPIRNGEELRGTLDRAEKRADAFARRILEGRAKQRGFRLASHAVGYFSQRMFWRKSEANKRSALKIDATRCVGCGKCAKHCPVGNLLAEGKRVQPRGKCVFCYRCVNLCPRRAITLFGSSPPERQYRGPERT